jgi:hypothetical protein
VDNSLVIVIAAGPVFDLKMFLKDLFTIRILSIPNLDLNVDLRDLLLKSGDRFQL